MTDRGAQLDPELRAYPSCVHAFDVALRERPQAPALVCGARRLSYAELGRAVAALAERLQTAGLTGKRVAVALPSSVEAVVAVLAVWYARAQLALVRCEADAGAYAQLYWSGPGEEFCEDRSLRIPVAAGDWREYVVHIDRTDRRELWDAEDEIQRLRFDPLNAPGMIELRELRLCAASEDTDGERPAH